MNSQWIKFYFFLVILLAYAHFRHLREFLTRKRSTVFLLLTLGILAQAAILQVTSYTPPDNNIFFHSFAIVFILTFLSGFLHIDFSRTKPLILATACLLLWWSGVYWKYFQRLTQRMMPVAATRSASDENLVNRQTYMIHQDTTEIPMSEWIFTGLKSFDKIYLPKPTVDGIHRLMDNKRFRNQKDLRVLNMTELTPLAAELPYNLETGNEIPLWYHLGVSMFNKEAAMYEQKIARKNYDLVLFEYIPTLNNFYPFRIRDSLKLHYQKIDSFFAPRRGDTKGIIEVYAK
jgi:hypothetical protein